MALAANKNPENCIANCALTNKQFENTCKEKGGGKCEGHRKAIVDDFDKKCQDDCARRAEKVTPLAARFVSGPVDLTLKPWDPRSVFARPEGAKDLASFELHFQPVRDTPPYRLEGQPAAYDRATMPLPLLLGDLLFHAPKLLGPRAGVFGLSCNTCHPGGASNNALFVEGHSDRAGNIDLLSAYFYDQADDGVFAPRNIPSLRGSAATSPYRRDGSVELLTQANALVVGHEFQQQVPAAWLAALSDYVARLNFQLTPHLDAEGRLGAAAPAEARAGEILFETPLPGLEGQSCAGCHPKGQAFTDRKQHALRHGDGKGVLGNTKRFDTPPLLNIKETAPYFFDGTAADLPAAVFQIDRRHGLGLSKDDQARLVSYLDAIGAVHSPPTTWSAEERVRQAMAWGRLVETTGDELWALCLDTMRLQVRLAQLGSKRTSLGRLAKELEALARKPPNPAVRARLAQLRREATR